MDTTSIQSDKKICGNPVYQQRQQRRQNYLEKKRALRKLFELGKLVEQAGLQEVNPAVFYKILLEAKEKLQHATKG